MTDSKFNFDVEKLRRLLERRDQFRGASRDLSERLRSAREYRGRVRGELIQQRQNYRGTTNPKTESQLEAAEIELARLQGEQEEFQEKNSSLLEVVNRCEEWARKQGWREDMVALPGAPNVLDGTEGATAAQGLFGGKR